MANAKCETCRFFDEHKATAPSRMNRAGFSGGRLVWLRRPRLGPRLGHNSVPPPRREGCGRSVRAADGG